MAGDLRFDESGASDFGSSKGTGGPCSQPIVNDAILKRLPKKRRDEFVRFVETAEASEDFLRYLDSDQDAIEAVDAALREREQNFLRLAAALRHSPSPEDL